MNRIIRKIIPMALFTLLAVSPVFIPKPALAATDPDAKAAICSGLAAGSGCSGDATGTVNGLLKTVINIFSAVVGFAAVIMIIVGGFKYITSSGDSNNINSAKNTILYAVVGLVIVAMAQLIAKFVLSKTK